MEYIEQIISILNNIPFFWLLIVAFVATFTENIFPPAPSDMLVVANAALIGQQDITLIWLVILFAVAGSTLGFYVMFLLGNKFEHKIIYGNKMPFISRKAIKKVENLFKKWGMWLVVVNRFMSGTRGVVSFFAGASSLPKTKTTLLASISSFLWYGLLCFAGGYFGKDWRIFYGYIEIYEKAIIYILIIIAIIMLALFFIKKYCIKANN